VWQMILKNNNITVFKSYCLAYIGIDILVPYLYPDWNDHPYFINSELHNEHDPSVN